MTTKLVNWASNDGQIIKSGLSDGRRATFLPSVAEFAYDGLRIDGFLGNVGLNQQQRAIAIAREAIGLDPDYIYAHCVLAIALVELGRSTEATPAVESILKIDPNFSIRVFAATQPFREAEVMERHLRGLRRAGLPE